MNPAHLPQVMVATARERGRNDVLRTMINGIAQCENVVLARIWLQESSELCDVCKAEKQISADSALHLVASAGTSRDRDVNLTRLDGSFHRFSMGERKIGLVAQSGQPLLLTNLSGDEEWVVNRAWVEREGIQTIAAQPLVFHDQVFGVLALFDRGILDSNALEWLRVFADYAAVSISNARAFEEIEILRTRLEEENIYLREEVDEALGTGNFIGESPALQKILRQVQLVAPTDASVLITGESGTGKELVARAIHENSERKRRTLIKVNCSAIPESLFESEFFGHVKGAFTGAQSDRVGRFELANGGTLFLDEIGEMPLSMQTKLLRVLQEHEFERVGDTRTRKVDVRIIAATNRDLKAEVEAGRFRQDLFYRLSVFPVEIPPLRERREDIPRLVQHFVSQSARRLNLRVPRVTQTALNQLASHNWPGNVRELQNVAERAVIVSQGGPLQFLIEQTKSPLTKRSETPDEPSTIRLLTRAELKQLEFDSIVQALKMADNRVSGPDGAAELLGMKPTTLSSRITALGVKVKTTR